MLYNFSNGNKTTLADFIESTNALDWNYRISLKLVQNSLKTASHAQLLSNPGDVADGVNRVEMKFESIFFGVFDGLVVKHRDEGSTPSGASICWCSFYVALNISGSYTNLIN
ncbi:hypothetical protein [Pedobacter helvus]|uniref:Uncharacterized protein n=1 Tax=Pedobacter helvus TaxID=2563444 RepID=A0ABW9JL24_9SPHI|nr:hypothetical protein [Pedobacter ureilyticus]